MKLNDELKSLYLAVNSHQTLIAYPHLGVGELVEVRSGPVRGVKGYSERRPDRTSKLILNVDILGRAVSMELDASLLEKV